MAYSAEPGGGIHNEATLVLRDVTIHNNRSDDAGGGIWNGGGYITGVNVTLSGNEAVGSGGGLANGAWVSSSPGQSITRFYNSTITANIAQANSNGLSAGGGISDRPETCNTIHGGCSEGSTFATHTIIVGNQADSHQDCFNGWLGTDVTPDYWPSPKDPYRYPLLPSDYVSDYPDGFNLLGTSCRIGGDDLVVPDHVVDRLLGPLANNGPSTGSGRTTLTHALLPGSPALDAGDPAGCTYADDFDVDTPRVPLLADQRGLPRPQDGDGDTIPRCDIGAYEAQTYVPGDPVLPPIGPVATVNASADPGDGICDAAECTLREALTYAPSDATIVFDLPHDSVIQLAEGALVVRRDLTIDGSAVEGLSIRGTEQTTVFSIAPRTNATLRHLIIEHGRRGVFHDGRQLTIEKCVIRNNLWQGIYSYGSLTVTDSAIVYNESSGILGANELSEDESSTATIINSMISHNGDGEYEGGGLWMRGMDVTVVNSTIADNHALLGGGISAWGNVVIVNSTVSGNKAETGGGIRVGGPNALRIVNSTVTENIVTREDLTTRHAAGILA